MKRFFAVATLVFILLSHLSFLVYADSYEVFSTTGTADATCISNEGFARLESDQNVSGKIALAMVDQTAALAYKITGTKSMNIEIYVNNSSFFHQIAPGQFRPGVDETGTASWENRCFYDRTMDAVFMQSDEKTYQLAANKRKVPIFSERDFTFKKDCLYGLNVAVNGKDLPAELVTLKNISATDNWYHEIYHVELPNNASSVRISLEGNYSIPWEKDGADGSLPAERPQMLLSLLQFVGDPVNPSSSEPSSSSESSSEPSSSEPSSPAPSSSSPEPSSPEPSRPEWEPDSSVSSEGNHKPRAGMNKMNGGKDSASSATSTQLENREELGIEQSNSWDEAAADDSTMASQHTVEILYVNAAAQPRTSPDGRKDAPISRISNQGAARISMSFMSAGWIWISGLLEKFHR